MINKNKGGIIVNIIFTLLLIGGAVVGFVFYATLGITQLARDQLSALRDHDYSKAYSYTSTEFQANTSLDAFTEFVSANPALDNNKDSTFNSRWISTGSGKISGTVEGADGTVTPIAYSFVKENGEWKIQGINIKPSNSGVSENEQSDSDESE
jgi:hypothetical protein